MIRPKGILFAAILVGIALASTPSGAAAEGVGHSGAGQLLESTHISSRFGRRRDRIKQNCCFFTIIVIVVVIGNGVCQRFSNLKNLRLSNWQALLFVFWCAGLRRGMVQWVASDVDEVPQKILRLSTSVECCWRLFPPA